jgi:hypothetical protein
MMRVSNNLKVYFPYAGSISVTGYNSIKIMIRSSDIEDFKKDLRKKQQLLKKSEVFLKTIRPELMKADN